MLGERILKHTDNLSKTLQGYSHVSSRGVAKLCIDVFKKIQTDDNIDLLWEFAKTIQNSLEVKDPILPRACKRSRHYENGLLNLTTLLMSNTITSKYTFSFDSAIATIENCF